MCMLTSIKYNGKETFTAPFMSDLLRTNASSKKNEDGTGFSQENVFWKTEKDARDIEHLGAKLSDIIKDGETAFGHVRAASSGVPVIEENSHPFVNEESGLLLYHNGTLNIVNSPEWHKTMQYKEKNAYSDSRLFLDELSVNLLAMKERDVVKALKLTMKNFYGKFAFLLRDNETGKSFAARGTTAPLYLSFLGTEKKPLGWIINTGHDELKFCIDSYKSRAEASGLTPVEFSKPLILAPETVFALSKNSVVPVAEIKQNTYTAPAKSKKKSYGGGWVQKNYTPETTVSSASLGADDVKNVDRIIKFMTDHFLSPMDIDLLFAISNYSPMSEASSDSVNAFVKDVIPKMSAPSNLRTWMGNRKLVNDYLVPEILYTKQYGLQWPWMCNDIGVVKLAMTKLENNMRLM